MSVSKKISASLEDYLEAIHEIAAGQSEVRARDIAGRLGVAASSVTVALRGLVERGYIRHKPYGAVSMTVAGKRLAEKIAGRHRILKRFFVEVLAVDDREADDCACKIEHIISDDILDRFTNFIENEAVKK